MTTSAPSCKRSPKGGNCSGTCNSASSTSLMIHVPLVITAALIPLAGYPLLYLPTHIVWLEMLIHPTALLVFQGLPSPDGFGSVDRRRAVQFFSRLEWLLIGVVGALMTILVTAGYLRSFETGDVDHGRAMALGVLTLSSATLTAALSRFRTNGLTGHRGGHHRPVARPHAGAVPGQRTPSRTVARRRLGHRRDRKPARRRLSAAIRLRAVDAPSRLLSHRRRARAALRQHSSRMGSIMSGTTSIILVECGTDVVVTIWAAPASRSACGPRLRTTHAPRRRPAHSGPRLRGTVPSRPSSARRTRRRLRRQAYAPIGLHVGCRHLHDAIAAALFSHHHARRSHATCHVRHPLSALGIGSDEDRTIDMRGNPCRHGGRRMDNPARYTIDVV